MDPCPGRFHVSLPMDPPCYFGDKRDRRSRNGLVHSVLTAKKSFPHSPNDTNRLPLSSHGFVAEQKHRRSPPVSRQFDNCFCVSLIISCSHQVPRNFRLPPPFTCPRVVTLKIVGFLVGCISKYVSSTVEHRSTTSFRCIYDLYATA